MKLHFYSTIFSKLKIKKRTIIIYGNVKIWHGSHKMNHDDRTSDTGMRHINRRIINDSSMIHATRIASFLSHCW